MISAHYWVIGGEFRSLDFDRLNEGTGRIWGPFATYGDAEHVWRENSEQHRSRCCTRFTIVHEEVRAGAIMRMAHTSTDRTSSYSDCCTT